MGVQISEGGCLCREVRYRLAGSPLFSVVCHCVSCRRASGAPTVAWLTVDRANFEILAGEPQAFRSSQGVLRRFCGLCGSPITYETDASRDTIDVTAASLDDPNRFPPTREVWLSHKVPWEQVNDRLAQFPQDSGWGSYADDRQVKS